MWDTKYVWKFKGKIRRSSEKLDRFDGSFCISKCFVSEQSPLMKSLVLSPMETVLLSVDWKILNVRQQENVLTHQEIWNKMKDYDNKSSHFGKYYSIYRYLKLNGWTVASGHTFGCDYCKKHVIFHYLL